MQNPLVADALPSAMIGYGDTNAAGFNYCQINFLILQLRAPAIVNRRQIRFDVLQLASVSNHQLFQSRQQIPLNRGANRAIHRIPVTHAERPGFHPLTIDLLHAELRIGFYFFRRVDFTLRRKRGITHKMIG